MDPLPLIRKAIREVVYRENSRIPKQDSVGKALGDQIAELYVQPVVDGLVVRDVINNQCFDKQLEISDARGSAKFTSSQVSSLAKNIDKQLRSLPTSYVFAFPMPHSEIKFSDTQIRYNIHLISSMNLAVPTARKKSGRDVVSSALESALLRASSKLEAESDDPVLKITVSGYVTKYDGPMQMKTEDPVYLYKVLTGLFNLKALYILYSPTGGAGYTSTYPAFRYSIMLGDKLYRKDEGDNMDEKERRTMQFDPGDFKIREDGSSRFADIIMIATKVITNVGSTAPKYISERQRQIRNSLYWYYEAGKIRQEFAKITYIVSAFDALMDASIATKEAKAQLISQAASRKIVDQEKIRKDVIEIYTLRNNIVHGITPISSLERYTTEGRKNRDIIYRALFVLYKYIDFELNSFTEYTQNL